MIHKGFAGGPPSCGQREVPLLREGASPSRKLPTSGKRRTSGKELFTCAH